MKKSSLLLLSSFIFLPRLFSQSVAINTDGTVANASSILDIKSTTKGLLIPRMTTVQRSAIAAPAKGLIVFDVTTNGLWFHDDKQNMRMERKELKALKKPNRMLFF